MHKIAGILLLRFLLAPGLSAQTIEIDTTRKLPPASVTVIRGSVTSESFARGSRKHITGDCDQLPIDL